MDSRVEIDGSTGEGGGQMLRSSLALSLATGRPVRVRAIRAGRSRPGLLRQHLAAVRAAATLGGARVRGAELGSDELIFEPTGLRGGRHVFRVGSAGSTSLVAQAVLPALLFGGVVCDLEIEGGTHARAAPPFEFLRDAWMPLLGRIGADVGAELLRRGFYPVGGGRIRVRVGAATAPREFELLERGRLLRVEARAVSARLPAHVAERELRTVTRSLGWPAECLVSRSDEDASGAGNVLLLTIVHEQVTEVFAGFGARGVPAEAVARRACEEACRWLATDAPVGPHLADQLLLPLVLGAGGRFRTTPLTSHARTNLDVIRAFLEVGVEVEPSGDGVVEVRVGSASMPGSGGGAGALTG